MPRSLQILILAVVLLAIATLATSVPDAGTRVVEAITAGGMWSALAVFIAAAILLGVRRAARDGAAGPPGDGPHR